MTLDLAVAVLMFAINITVTVGAILYSAGRLRGSVSTRLDHIERRLGAIEDQVWGRGRPPYSR